MTDLMTLESVAQQLAARVREDDPRDVWRWLGYSLADPADWFRLAILCAAAIPPDRTWRELTAWADELSGSGCPQGTSAPVHRPSTGLSTGISAARSRPG